MAFGYYLSIDLYDCDTELVDSIKAAYDFLIKLPQYLDMERQGPPNVYRIDLDDPKYPDKAGISAWVALITSGVQLHTITPKNFVSIDIYTCGELCPEGAIEFCKNFFKAGKAETNYLERGKDYGNI